jgi:uncharacterized protein (DUF1330 family)
MTGYAITQIEVTNPEDYKKYLEKVTDIVTKFGGEYLVRGGEYQCFEGEWKKFATGNNPIAKPIFDECVESVQMWELNKVNL